MHKSPKLSDSTAEDSIVSPEKINKNQYITSSLCGSGTCVGVARLENGIVAVQDTKNLTGQPLTFTKDEWQAFIAGVKNDEFDV